MTTTRNNRPDPHGGPTGRVAPIDDAEPPAGSAAAVAEAGGAGPLPAEAGQVSEKEARQVAEAARETAWDRPSFGKELFLGRFRLDLINPWPRSDPADVARAGEFLGALGRTWTPRWTAPRSSGTRTSRTRCSTGWPGWAPSA